MSYTHGSKWNKELILEGILGVKNALGTEYMPSKSEMLKITGTKALSCAMTRHGGHTYFRNMLELEDKDSCTKTGDENEDYIMTLLKEQGYKPRKTPPRHPYDILVNDVLKIDVKSANPTLSKVKEMNEFVFSINNEYPKCDLFIFVTQLKNNKEVYIIPSNLVMQSQLGIGETSKYDCYKNRYDYIEKYISLFKSIA
jgi:hypothetical protein